ncbi:PadR family transcriptional regulator [Paramaledivibacter caminithermalis]|jgi:DNA-binding PadR family transcriptional regulator|uniref:Transcriptional regulator PadR-like family protein n=1 Tax=Paramaledivibacter caminithermalis (strain DSM 15212 / CIP 107654 / DViRD3) TaxID=1121301 RepID=A0A1M6RLA2_PARC5|nr:PadR family transcriptional regulator [Paramaledivibacter caminithermalis]SHK33127.1 Transcriptional regulator PadR-like family protein [Paramaledivibacter caminithermalis DSM 15212]
MKEKILRKLFLGFMQIHILYHAKHEPIYGTWMMKELEEHGYTISPGTLYPLLNRMEKEDLLCKTEKNVDGRIIKFYRTTELGEEILKEAIEKATELTHEIRE